MADDNMEIVRALHYSPHREKKQALDITRQQSAEAFAALMPETMAALRELLLDPDPNVRFKAIKLIADKNLPNPLGERPTSTEREVDGEVITEDVREIREKLFLEYKKQEDRKKND